MMDISRLEHVTLDTPLFSFPITRYPGYKFLLEGHICSLWVNAIILKHAPDCSTLLLLQRSACDSHSGCWELPGSKVDYGDQTLRIAAERVVKGRTGRTELQLLDTVLSKTWDTPRVKGKHNWLSFTFLAIVDRQTGRICSAGKMNLDSKWFTKDDVLRMDEAAFYGNQLESILGAFDTVENVNYLSHHGPSNTSRRI